MTGSYIDSLLEDALNAIGEPVFLVATDFQYLSCKCVLVNKAFETLLGWSNQTVDIEQFWPTFKPASLETPELAALLKAASKGQEISAHLSIRELKSNSQGIPMWIVRVRAHNLSDSAPLQSEKAKFEGLAHASAQDSFHAQRLETLGMLASGIAHDFNNILAGVLGHVSYLKTVLPARGPHLESLLSIEEGARKATGMTQQILKFSKYEETEPACELDLSDIVIRTVKLLRGAISPEVHLDLAVPDCSFTVLGAEGRLAQVLINIVVNARDALLENGRIRISVAKEQDQARLQQALGATELPCGSYACITVSDNGRGMSPDVMTHMFDPYFTTKQGKGSGLGLAMVKTIVQELGGTVQVTSQVGTGTDVCVYLPLIEHDPAAYSKSAHSAHIHSGPAASGPAGIVHAREHERILIVDDESPVRNVLSISLQHLGYRVETAASGVEALEKYAERTEPINLVILDMLMPHLSGERVFLKLREMDPKARVMLISGYTSEDAVERVLKGGGLDFIQKPFTIEELSRRVRNCLEKAVFS